MINSGNFITTSSIILTILISATMISYTTKFIFESNKVKKSTDLMYDPDQGLNISAICVLSKDPYVTSYEKSPCFNKTLAQWHNPWLRHSLWTSFWNKIKVKKQLEQMIQEKPADDVEIPLVNETVLPTDLPKETKNEEVTQIKEKPIEFVYSILVGLLVISGVVACWEVCKDKLKRNGGSAAKAQDRQCSLADFTINRHLRRESQQQSFTHLPRQGSLELTAKVTQNLIHQSSLDRTFPKMISEALTLLESRRNSMPVSVSSDSPTGTPSSPGPKLKKRPSVDVPGEEISLDLRKKSRHFIRRH